MKKKVIAGTIIVLVLVFTYWWGGNAPGLRGWKVDNVPGQAAIQTEKAAEEKEYIQGEERTEISEHSEKAEESEAETEQVHDNTSGIVVDSYIGIEEQGSLEYSMEQGMVIDEETGTDQYKTEPVPEDKPVPVEPQNTEINDKEMTCTISIRCDTIYDNLEWFDSEKVELLPEDGIILAEQTAVFYEGESVFNVLARETKRNKIHLEFVNTPIFNSAYIEGIANIYEFDCGETSGWIYEVNDWAPNYGCSRYKLQNGDRIEWVYTCNLGVDVRSYYATAQD